MVPTLCGLPPYDDFKIFPQPICSSKPHKYENYDKTIYKVPHLGPYIYDVHSEGGRGSLGICHVFADSIAFKQ